LFFDIAYGSKVRHCYVLAMRMKNLIFFNSVQLSWRYCQVLQNDLRGHQIKFQANWSRFDLLPIASCLILHWFKIRSNWQSVKSWLIDLKFILVTSEVTWKYLVYLLIAFEKCVHCYKNNEKLRNFLTVCN